MSVPYRRTFVRLLGFLRPYRASLIVSSVLAILAQGAAITVLLLTGSVIDELDGAQRTQRSSSSSRRSSRSACSRRC